jgi:hypothetical protein
MIAYSKYYTGEANKQTTERYRSYVKEYAEYRMSAEKELKTLRA